MQGLGVLSSCGHGDGDKGQLWQEGETSNASVVGVVIREWEHPWLGSDTVKGTKMALIHRNKQTDRCGCLVRWALIFQCQQPVHFL